MNKGSKSARRVRVKPASRSFATALETDRELSAIRSEFTQASSSARRKAAEWAYNQSLADDLVGAAFARISEDALPAPKWPPGFVALAIDPDYSHALLTVGCYEHGSGRRAAAMKLLLRLAGLPMTTSSSSEWNEIVDRAGEYLVKAGDPINACRLYEVALTAKPNQQEFITGMGWALCRTGKQVEALSWMERAIANAPNDSVALSDYGWALTELGRFEEAEPILERAVRCANGDNELPKNNLERMRVLRKRQSQKTT